MDPRRTRFATLTAIPAAAVVVVATSWGGDPPVVVTVQYDAADSCPSTQAFLSEIRQRTSRVDLAEARGGPSSFVVRIAPSPTGFRGQLEAIAEDGVPAVRELDAATCSEVASALATVLALAVDPAADTASVAGPPPSNATPPDVSSAPTTPLPPAPSAVRAPAPPLRPAAPPATARADEAPPREWWIGAHALLDYATAAPGWMPGVELSGENASADSLAWDRSMRVAVWYSTSQATGRSGGARVRWFGARFEACPVDARLTRGWDAGPCAGLGIGALDATGLIDHPNHTTRPWGDLWFSARTRLKLAAPLAMEAQGGLVAPLLRYTYEFGSPAHTFYDVPVVSGRFWLGISGRIP